MNPMGSMITSWADWRDVSMAIDMFLRYCPTVPASPAEPKQITLEISLNHVISFPGPFAGWQECFFCGKSHTQWAHCQVFNGPSIFPTTHRPLGLWLGSASSKVHGQRLQAFLALPTPSHHTLVRQGTINHCGTQKICPFHLLSG